MVIVSIRTTVTVVIAIAAVLVIIISALGLLGFRRYP
jgi:hypothetical protein